MAAIKPLSEQPREGNRIALSCGLTQFPTDIFAQAETLEILDLSNNQLRSLPDTFGQFKKLKIAFFNNNCFEEIPEVLSQCPNLSMVGFKANQIKTFAEGALPPTVRWLILTGNQLEQLPTSMGSLTRLQKLMLAGNQLRSLPQEMAACTRLELIRLAANQLEALPDWLLALPRLAWIAYAGNPFCRTPGWQPRPNLELLPEIDWASLTVGETLGQGASGVISKALWHPPQAPAQAVAIKLFKGDLTSDGLPSDEMQACIAAGAHNHLVSVLGRLTRHPEDRAGLVFSCIPPQYQTLGRPPSLESCTRDVYEPGTTFSIAVVLHIAQGIAAAAAHLHARGILHGDLYAHNILVDDQGHSVLGDFGAASFYDPSNQALAQILERIEVRAFGCLLEDLLDHCPAAAQPNTVEQLRHLQQSCMEPELAQRPAFATIGATLTKLVENLA